MWLVDLSQKFPSRKVFAGYAVCWFITLATMAAAIVIYLADLANEYPIEKMIEHVALCVVALITLNIPMLMHVRYNFHFPPVMHIAIVFFIVAHFVLGEVYRFYDHLILFDKLLHITGGIVMAVCGFSIVHGFSRTENGGLRLPPFFVSMFSFCFSVTLLALWEIFEYAVDTISGINMQRWQDGLSETVLNGATYMVTRIARGSGLVDTMNDLIVGIIGAGIICTIGGLWFRKNPGNTKYLIVRKPLNKDT